MLADKGIGVAAISVDAYAAGRVLTDRLGLGFPVLADPQGLDAIRAFGVFDPENEIAWPSIFIVDRDGKIVKRWLADTYTERIPTTDVLDDL